MTLPQDQPLQLQHTDARRTISETLLQRDTGPLRVTLLDVTGPARLGDHYHRVAVETFVLVSGTATLSTAAVDENGTQGPISRQELTAPTTITIPTGVAHTFTFTGPGQLMALVSHAFDPADTVVSPLP